MLRILALCLALLPASLIAQDRQDMTPGTMLEILLALDPAAAATPNGIALTIEEVPVLVRWLAQHGRCMPIDYDIFRSGNLAELIGSLVGQGRPKEVEPSGVEEAVDRICAYLPAF